MSTLDADVLVVGLGPVGALLALRLQAAGLRPVVVEREAAPFPLPRAVAADGEVLELLERAAPGSTHGFVRDPPVRFVSGDGRELGRLRFPAPGLAFYRQPVLEQRLRAALRSPVVRGELRGLVQDRSGVTARVGGQVVRAGWLVGCDGAGSLVRRRAGMGWRGRDLPDPWLVCDVDGEVPERPLFTYTCDPALPQVDMPVPGGHRWEWLLSVGAPEGLLPGAEPAGVAARLLRRDTAADVRVVRAVPYRLGARRAVRWRTGRVLLAGDAAHTMPPFAGQGLGAGLRDAWALAALLARDAEGGAALDRYQALREPHVRRTTALSLLLGRLVTARSAGVRDALLAAAFRSPGLGPWLARGGPRPDVSGVLDL